MASIIVGSVIIARGAVAESDGPQGESNWPLGVDRVRCLSRLRRSRTHGAGCGAVDWRVPNNVDRPLLWPGLHRRHTPLAADEGCESPRNGLPYVGLQGLLDTAGYFTFLAGANTAAPHITMVVASAFSVVTVLLARLVIHEPVSKMQWGAIALIAAGTAALSAT